MLISVREFCIIAKNLAVTSSQHINWYYFLQFPTKVYRNTKRYTFPWCPVVYANPRFFFVLLLLLRCELPSTSFSTFIFVRTSTHSEQSQSAQWLKILAFCRYWVVRFLFDPNRATKLKCLILTIESNKFSYHFVFNRHWLSMLALEESCLYATRDHIIRFETANVTIICETI